MNRPGSFSRVTKHAGVERQRPPLHLLENRHSCHRLGEAGNAEESMRLNRNLFFDMGEPDRPGVEQLTRATDGERRSRDGVLLQEAAKQIVICVESCDMATVEWHGVSFVGRAHWPVRISSCGQCRRV